MMGLESYIKGQEGENRAARFLEDKGYLVIDRNFHSTQGEIDLVAKDKDCLVFVEVKNYSYRSWGSAFSSVGRAKKQAIIHAARTYLFKKRIKDINCRFDVVVIFNNKIEHLEGAFSC